MVCRAREPQHPGPTWNRYGHLRPPHRWRLDLAATSGLVSTWALFLKPVPAGQYLLDSPDFRKHHAHASAGTPRIIYELEPHMIVSDHLFRTLRSRLFLDIAHDNAPRPRVAGRPTSCAGYGRLQKAAQAEVE